MGPMVQQQAGAPAPEQETTPPQDESRAGDQGGGAGSVLATTPEGRASVVRVEQELRLVLRRAAAAQADLARRVHADLDASAFPLVAVIGDESGIRATELAQRFGIGRATISRQLARLEQLGLIQRVTDPSDSRGQLLSLTALGEEQLASTRSGRLAHYEQVFQDWDDADLERLAELLARYSASAATPRAKARQAAASS